MEDFQIYKPIYDNIIAALQNAVSDKLWLEPVSYTAELTSVLSSITMDKKLISKIADGLSVMDKNAAIQRDKKGNIIYDKSTKDAELVKWEDDIEIKYQDGTLWLTQKMIAKLFDVNIPAISKHLQNIYESEELDKSSTISKMEIVQHEGSREVTRAIDHYNLDAVISVGY